MMNLPMIIYEWLETAYNLVTNEDVDDVHFDRVTKTSAYMSCGPYLLCGRKNGCSYLVFKSGVFFQGVTSFSNAAMVAGKSVA